MEATLCVIVCRRCAQLAGGEPLVMPFGSQAERGEWAAAHTAGTGHRDWLVLDDWPSVAEVKALLAAPANLLRKVTAVDAADDRRQA